MVLIFGTHPFTYTLFIFWPQGERWGGAEDTGLLDEVGAELLLVGGRPNPPIGERP